MTPNETDDDNFELDRPTPGAVGVPSDEAGALYNYLLLARGSALGVHNPNYAKQIIYDSFFALEGSAPATIVVRP